VGAKTVNGPGPERVSTKSATESAATSVVSLLATAREGMSELAHLSIRIESRALSEGMRTWSITCTTPLKAATSAVVTVASFIFTAPPDMVTVTSVPSTVDTF